MSTPKERLAVCKSCPFMIKGPFRGAETCAKCGCFVRAKVQVKHWACPDNRWN